MGEARGKGKRVAGASETEPLDEYGGGGACAECTSLCRSLHRTRNYVYPIANSFFKVMIGPDWDQFMLLPPKYKETVIDLVGRETVLKDAMGQKWTVTLSSSSDGLVFSRGWQTFVSDHNITMGDFLVFNYIRGSHFTVQIFGRTSCEKKCSGHRFKETTQAKQHEHVNSDATNIQILSISDASESKFQPSAADGTRDSGGGNVKPPCLDKSPRLGNINKTVTKEQQETSGCAPSRANRKRGLRSQYVDTISKQAKLEPLGVPPSYIATVTCLAVADGLNHLELPAKLPNARFKKSSGGESKAVLLKDQEGRLWPALYIQKASVHVLVTNWDKFNKKNGIQAGDSYVFQVENSSEATYKIDVLRQ